MGLYIGANKGKPHLGSNLSKQKDNFTSLDWKYEDGQFLFSINNITPDLAVALNTPDPLVLAVVRYHSANTIKRNNNKKKKTYPHAITLKGGSGYDVVAETRISINSYYPNFKNMDFTSIIDGLAINDNSRFRKLSLYATEKTSKVLEYNWRDYGFAIIKGTIGSNVVLLESRERLRMKLMDQNILQFASTYVVINKKEIQITE